VTDAADRRHQAMDSTGDAMTDSGVRLLALTILFPVLVIVALAVALVGCDAQLSVSRPRLRAARPCSSPSAASTKLVSIPLGGGAARTLATGLAGAGGLALDAPASTSPTTTAMRS
jgi:hypothetical protein